MIFMFNRAAATEVNQRIAAVKIDGKNLVNTTPQIASTFHKFALETIKSFGVRAQIIDENEHESLVSCSLDQSLNMLNRKVSLQERNTLLAISNNFINRAGQKFPGMNGLGELKDTVNQYIANHESHPEFRQAILWHRVATLTYEAYLQKLHSPRIDFNMLMAHASEMLDALPSERPHFQTKYIMVDEYQDFSYLFFRLIMAVRRLTPNAHLFVVGDDWQAINRFAGSDVDYFINFARYFPENQITIPLATNYRSCHRIVTTANHFMLNHYDASALPAIPKNRKSGKVIFINPTKTKFDVSDYLEDGLADGRYLTALFEANPHLKRQPHKQVLSAAKLLKPVSKIIRRQPNAEFMLLHRHNFTTCPGMDLLTFARALEYSLNIDGVLAKPDFCQQVRCMTMHKSKGLEAEIVILLEFEPEVVRASHPLATIFELFGDTSAAEYDDQSRLIYVALTRAKQKLYVLTSRTELITK